MAPAGQSSDVDLSRYFQMPEKAVAQELGICLTSLKKMCRQQGINRWPYRKIKSLDKKLRDLEDAMSSNDPSLQMLTSNCIADLAGDEHYDAPSPSNSEGTDASVATTPRQNHEVLDLECPVVFSRPPSVSAAKQRQTTRSPVSTASGEVRNHPSPSASLSNRTAAPMAAVLVSTPSAPASACPAKLATELSDEDLISMLAECVAKPSPAPAPPAKPAHADCFLEACDGSAISLGQRDAEILSELVGCAAPFQLDSPSAFATSHDFGFSAGGDGHDSFARHVAVCEEDFADGLCWAWSSGPQEMR